jgi:hypothetical protein
MQRVIAAVRGCRTAAEIDALAIDFAVGDWAGNAVALRPDTPVTIENRDAFCRLFIEARISQITVPLTAFRRGFNMIIEAPWIRLFGPLELEKMICGEKEFPMERMKKILDAKEDNPNWTRLLTVLERLSSEERFNFLAFATGSPSLLPDGFEQPRVSVEFKEGSHMPVSHTCMRRIEISICSSDDELEKLIRVAMEFGGTFQLA